MDRVGFVGLGDMGGAIAQRIIGGGVPTTLWSRSPHRLTPFTKSAAIAADLHDLAHRSDVVGLCVFDDQDVRDVSLGDRGVLAAMSPGSVLVVHSTVSISVCEELQAAAAPRRIGVLDAPVTGGRPAALAGKLAVMVGGERAVYERVIPVLRTFGTVLRHLGPLGSGQSAKALNTALHWGTGEIALTALDLARQLGLDVDAAVAILRGGAAGSRSLDLIADRLATDKDFALHIRQTVEKDLTAFDEALRRRGVDAGAMDTFTRARTGRESGANAPGESR